MNTKHTPGPWVIDGFRDEHDLMTADRRMIAKINGLRPAMLEDEDNARLIAAAPELLEALEAVLKAVGPYDSGLPVEQIKAAIAKAKGE